jgi:hypothetical protein
MGGGLSPVVTQIGVSSVESYGGKQSRHTGSLVLYIALCLRWLATLHLGNTCFHSVALWKRKNRNIQNYNFAYGSVWV